jgi:hypothetical protein
MVKTFQFWKKGVITISGEYRREFSVNGFVGLVLNLA